MRISLESIIKHLFRKEKKMGEEEKKEIPGIYDIPESEEYRKGKIDKQFIKKVLLTYGSPSQVRAYEEISGIKLDEE